MSRSRLALRASGMTRVVAVDGARIFVSGSRLALRASGMTGDEIGLPTTDLVRVKRKPSNRKPILDQQPANQAFTLPGNRALYPGPAEAPAR